MSTGIALSGGGSRGFAHIGVVKALLEKNISFDAISGTSAGAIMGVFLADGFSPEEIFEIFKKYEVLGVFNFIVWGSGLLSHDKLKKILSANLRSKTFEQLKIPFYVTATDFTTGKQKVFNSGELLIPIVASASIPVLFPPVFINSIPYVDGGISSNLPVEPLLNKVDKLIGVYVNPLSAYSEKASITQKMDRTMHLSLRRNVLENIEKCDVFIEPAGLEKFHLFESKKINDIVSLGYNYTKAHT